MADLRENAITLLSTTTVDLSGAADTTLYTVPTSKRCVITSAVLVVDAAAGDTTISIGADGTETDFVPVTSLAALVAQYDACILQPIPSTTVLLNKSYAAATVIQAQVAIPYTPGGATNTLYLFGFLY